MIERDREHIRVGHPNGVWRAVHDAENLGRLLALTSGASTILQDCRFYVDDMFDSAAVTRKVRAFRKGGAAVVSSSGYFPFGRELQFSQQFRYAGNHVRITSDLRWRRGATVRRHLGVGMLFLPGQWRRFFCVPPSLHLIGGVRPNWQSIPPEFAVSTMLGHWHRPPLALVFEREDGTALEVGTGSDLWRWEDCLGFGPESGSYKLFQENGGLQLVREPLMCCQEFAPVPRDYRFTWHLAWRAARMAPGESWPEARLLDLDQDHGLCFADSGKALFAEPVHLDFAGISWPGTCRRSAGEAAYGRNERTENSCWQCAHVQKTARRAIRQLAARSETGRLLVSGLTPGLCWDPAHLERKRADGLAHWDINGILDLAVWARQQLGNGWEIRTEQTEWRQELPSLTGLFSPNGFDAREPAPEIE